MRRRIYKNIQIRNNFAKNEFNNILLKYMFFDRKTMGTVSTAEKT